MGRIVAALAFLTLAVLLALSSIKSQLPAADVHALAAVGLIVAPVALVGVALILARGSRHEPANVATFVE
jgi:hypothetical protein